MRPRLAPAAKAVQQAATGRLADSYTNRYGAVLPARIFTQPGAVVAWDACSGGQLAVRVIRLTPRTPPPGSPGSRATGPNPMAAVSAWVVRMGVQLIQCVSTVNDQGRPPTPAMLSSEADEILEDAESVRVGLLCDLDSDYRCRLIQWTPVGPEGGVAGGEWEIEIDLPS